MLELNHGGAPVRGVCEADHLRVPAQDRAHHLALHTDAAAVDDAHLTESLLPRLREVFLHNGRDFGRQEAVQVNPILDRNLDRIVRQNAPFPGRLQRMTVPTRPRWTDRILSMR
jgi:hypothetical protein